MTDVPAPAPAPDLAPTTPPARGISVLLVDDQPIVGEAVRRMVATEPGLRWRYCGDPRLAVDAAKEFEPTVILSDLVMPQMDGLELVRRFRADEATRRTPLIVLSSREEPATKAEAFGLGANDYLVKLPDRIELLARIRYHSAAYVGRLERDEAYEALSRSQKLLADDLEQASRYVSSLLPEPLEGRVRARWRFIPSASLGGDAFGYHWLDDDHLVCYLLDVSGHGVGAALLGVSVLNIVRSQALPGTDFREPGQVLAALNGAFQTENQGGKFFTIWYGVFRASTRELRWAGGGHPDGLLVPRGAGEVRRLECGGPMPGVIEGIPYTAASTTVPPGARLLLYSDGVYELAKPDGAVLGLDEFVADVGAACAAGEEPLEAAVSRAERLRTGASFADDVSVVQFDFP